MGTGNSRFIPMGSRGLLDTSLCILPEARLQSDFKAHDRSIQFTTLASVLRNRSGLFCLFLGLDRLTVVSWVVAINLGHPCESILRRPPRGTEAVDTVESLQ